MTLLVKILAIMLEYRVELLMVKTLVGHQGVNVTQGSPDCQRLGIVLILSLLDALSTMNLPKVCVNSA